MAKMSKGLYYNLEKISEFIFDEKDGRSSDVEISEMYVYSDLTQRMEPNTKEVKETKYNDSGGQQGVRFTIIQTLMSTIDTIDNEEFMTIGQNTAMNTMKAYGFVDELQ